MQKSFLHRIVLVICAAAGVFCWGMAAAEDTPRLSSHRQPDDLLRVEVGLEVNGQLKVTEGGKSKSLPLHVQASFQYDERILRLPTKADGSLGAVRRYRAADATLKVGDAQLNPNLDPGRRLIAVEVADGVATLFCPNDLLTREELDLIDVPGNSLLLDDLLPERAVTVGEQWEINEQVLMGLLGLEAIAKAEVNAKLTGVRDNVAWIDLGGRVEGAVGGAPSELELKAKLLFDLGNNRVTRFALAIGENRAIGHVAPGLDVIAKVQVSVSPIAESESLTDEALADLPLEPSPERTALAFHGGGGLYRLVLDRRWHVVRDAENLTILRLVDRGEVVGQCNIAAAAEEDATKQVSLQQFQRGLREALGDRFGQFIEANQVRAAQAGAVYRVVVRGQSGKVPLRWTYYLVRSRPGQQVVLAFSVEEALVERFAEADLAVLRNFRFADRQASPAGRTLR